MNRTVLTTFGFGPAAAYLDISLPTFAAYAQHHGMDLYVPAPQRFDGLSRACPWWKIPLLVSLLGAGYETVLWLDSDVVVRHYDKNILDDASEAPMSMVVQETPDGAVPSTGVWVVRETALESLHGLWALDGFRRSECWWEQAAVISALGGDPDAGQVFVPPGPLWGSLPYEWNPHVRDPRGAVGGRFFHATGFDDRRAAMIENRSV